MLKPPLNQEESKMEKSATTSSKTPLLERMMRRKPMQVIQAEVHSTTSEIIWLHGRAVYLSGDKKTYYLYHFIGERPRSSPVTITI